MKEAWCKNNVEKRNCQWYLNFLLTMRMTLMIVMMQLLTLLNMAPASKTVKKGSCNTAANPPSQRLLARTAFGISWYSPQEAKLKSLDHQQDDDWAAITCLTIQHHVGYYLIPSCWHFVTARNGAFQLSAPLQGSFHQFCLWKLTLNFAKRTTLHEFCGFYIYLNNTLPSTKSSHQNL